MKKLASVSLALAISLGTVSPVAALDMGSMASAATSAFSSNPLVGSLVSSLGVSPTQALGGVSAIMGKIREAVGNETFNQLVGKVPGLSSIMNNAAANSLNTSGGSLADQFKSLGMDPDMVDKFTPIVEKYLGEYVSPDTLSMVTKALM